FLPRTTMYEYTQPVVDRPRKYVCTTGLPVKEDGSLAELDIRQAARNAMAQQKRSESPSVPIPFPLQVTCAGNLTLLEAGADALSLRMNAAPRPYRQKVAESVRFRLPRPLNMVSGHSGLAFTLWTGEECSPEVRIGCRLIGATEAQAAEILPYVPVLSAWGENPREVYLDWQLLNYADVNEALAVLRSVREVEFTFASALRAPRRGSSTAPQPARLTLSQLRLVDYLKGSFDPARHDWKPGVLPDLTLQHRAQEVTGIVARFGGAEGVRSAVDSLDLCARTQCWDGSFLDCRRGPTTVASGEYTFGFTLYGLLCAYRALEEMKCPLLEEPISFGPVTLRRRDAYQRMFYRGAMARTAALPSEYRDDIIGGDTLITGANRVLGYAIAMRMIADTLSNPAQKQEVLEKYQPIIQQIAEAQGKYSGGFPILGEGDRYAGQGIHYDAGYIRTHMDWLVLGVRQTGDPRLVQILERYQRVFEAVMNARGTGLMRLVSERSPRGGDVSLVLPDATAQVGMAYQLPIIAQWGYNCSRLVWSDWEQRPGGHFGFASRAQGYPLGAHTSILLDDLAPHPEPKDLGYRFPRQFPIWSSRLYNKQGELLRTSRVTIAPDGTTTNDFHIGVGEYPVTVGVPVRVESPDGHVTAVAESLSGWPPLLPDGAPVEIAGDATARGKIGEPVPLLLKGPTRLRIVGPDVTLPPEAGGARVPFVAELTLTPERADLPVRLTVVRQGVEEGG
ncbi:MAG: hypothetical protein QHJ73_01485, partial [Armatimonadota bacterium]|nr:hypothetical protein [Armatimonadota bacterium]